MNRRRIDEELSAYLDGEASDPEGVKRLLQKDKEAARFYVEMAKLSAHLRSLQPPEKNPAFASKVLRRIELDETEPRMRGLGLLWPALAGICACALAVLVGLTAMRDGGPSEVPRLAEVDTAAVMGELERRFAEAPDAAGDSLLFDEEVASPVFGTGQDELGEGALGVLVALSEAQWFGELAPGVGMEEDIDAMLGALTESETEALKELLVEYAEKGWTT